MGTIVLKHGSLREIVSQISSFTDKDFICANGRPNWTADSSAWVVKIPQYTDLRSIGAMPDYFLEVFTAREVLEGWSTLRGGRCPTLDETCEARIY